MSSKGFKLDFDAELPVKERRGRQKTEYRETIEKFLDSGKPKALVEIPEDETAKPSSLRIGFKNAIERMGVEDKVKPSLIKGKLYLYTRDYAKEQGWKWFIERQIKSKETGRKLGKKRTYTGKK